MAHHALGGTDRGLTPEKLSNSFAFRCVVEGSRRSMSIDVIDCRRLKVRTLERSLHGLSRSNPRRMRLGQMMIICRDTVTDNFSENRRSPFLRGCKIFQREDRSAFTEHHAGTSGIKRAASLRGGGLQRIEPNKNQFRKRVVATRQYLLIAPGANTLEAVTDCICSGSTRVRNHLTRRIDSECFLCVDHRLLWWIVR